MAVDTKKEPVFSNLQAEDPSAQPTEIESLCVNCGSNGVTKLLLTKIPHYKEVILMSFSCDECGFQNNEIQSGGQIQEQGVTYVAKIQNQQDLSRQVVKSDYASLTVPEIDLEIPANSQKGAISTIEGILQRTVAGLTQDQPVRRHLDPDGAKQIDDFVTKVEDLLSLKHPFSLIVSDPSGNSFVENLHAPRSDPSLDVSRFLRSREQDHALGLYTEEEVAAAATTEETDDAKQGGEEELSSTTSSTLLLREDEKKAETVNGMTIRDVVVGEATGTKPFVSASQKASEKKQQESVETIVNLTEEILSFPTNCPLCGSPAATNMKVTNIPHFKEVVIMATVCEFCGHKTNEVKSGGGIEPKGKRIKLRVTDPSDMSRDVLKSETCALVIPELEFEMGGYALGGRFTTLEGLLDNIKEQVDTNPMLGAMACVGDSATTVQREKIEAFKSKMDDMIACKIPMTIILDDPAGNSYVQNTYAPDDDPEMDVESYERSYEQNDELGLNDMKTENYGEHAILGASKVRES